MYNESQNNNINEDDISEMITENHNDIEFEEIANIDINEIQNRLKKELGEEEEKEEEKRQLQAEVPNEEVDKQLEAVISQFPIADITTDEPQSDSIKKYVVYVDADNVEYMENLSIDDRKKVINEVLREQYYLTKEERAILRKKQFISHLILSIITFVVFLPLIFILVNKAAIITVENYNTAKSNFTKLYKEHGRIKKQ